jgi:hypothetical protein
LTACNYKSNLTMYLTEKKSMFDERLDGRWDFLVPISPNKDALLLLLL